MFRRLALVVTIAFVACGGHSPTSPVDAASLPHGRLTGAVTIGPNCPNEQPQNPCPPAPGAFSLRKVLIYDSTATKLLFTVDIDSHGLYLIELLPGIYTVDLQKSGIDRSADVPAKVTITANHVTTLNIAIDTGLR